MATPLESRRIVIAGASSLLGAEIKTLLEESRFAASDFRLVDEETVSGILTEAGGEPAVIQAVEEDSFNKAWIIFFTGTPAFTKRNFELAVRSGARIVDLSGEFAAHANSQTWLAKFDAHSGAAPSNVSSAGETSLQLAAPHQDTSTPAAWWFWAAADNLRLPAANALKLAEQFLAEQLPAQKIDVPKIQE